MTAAERLYEVLPAEARRIVDEIARKGGISRGAAVATVLMRDALNDYCPEGERSKVIATLLRIEMGRQVSA